MIAAIDWVIQHAHDPGLNIRVLNLSYGTNSTQAYSVDPLAYAAEQAWKHGIVVVAAAGNTGYQRGHGAPGLADPAYDPYVIAVGASNSMGTQTTSDDDVATFSASPRAAALQGPRLRGSRFAPAGPARGQLLHRRQSPRGPARHPLLPRQRHVGGGRHHVRCDRARPAEVPDDDAGSRQAVLPDNAAEACEFDSQAQGAGEIRLAGC